MNVMFTVDLTHSREISKLRKSLCFAKGILVVLYFTENTFALYSKGRYYHNLPAFLQYNTLERVF